MRNTSTDVEKTLADSTRCVSVRKHLHGRGEDEVLDHSTGSVRETPPRTWRRLSTIQAEPAAGRNTSTDVEKTLDEVSLYTIGWKHLHGRGEDILSFASSFATTETPPRTWRRRSREFHKLFRGRNTSTDVEKTTLMRVLPPPR